MLNETVEQTVTLTTIMLLTLAYSLVYIIQDLFINNDVMKNFCNSCKPVLFHPSNLRFKKLHKMLYKLSFFLK